jgi:hypothetical protein
MEWAAFITWVVTALFGFTMLVIWLRHGGMQQPGGGGKIPPWLILSHFLLAASGLVVWIVYLAVDKEALTWIAFAILAVIALLGWARQRSAVAVPDGGAAARDNAQIAAGAELRFPIPVVVLHGLFA